MVLGVLAVLVVLGVGLSGAVRTLRVHEIAGEGRAGLIKGVDPCPPDRACAISPQPSAPMWEATYLAFPGYDHIATTVVFDASTGQSFSESLTLTNGPIVVRLTATREPGAVPRAVVVGVTAASSEGMVVTAVPVTGPPDRTAIAALSGPEDLLLPVQAAIAWASTVDLFGDQPR